MPIPESPERRFSYEDYVTWPDDERWEIIDGEPYAMTPAPTTRHQSIVAQLTAFLAPALRGHPCRVFPSPIDVVLSPHDVVQPDVIVVCDRTKITPANIQGAPDLVVEILSPSTSLKDRRTKFALYERHGVREYLLVDPEGATVEAFSLGEDGAFQRARVYGRGETLELRSLGGLPIALGDVFGAEEL
ncbi:MAG: Uma2 family endonuclease [Deltaproteobacteria bacterium]|nr:Uma2 family endonuclease [Deltaproteobacteria bacterium]